jgi:hypothetical protein
MPWLHRQNRLVHIRIGLFLALILGCATGTLAQSTAANAAQRLVFAGLRSATGKGQINAMAADPAGNLFLALDQQDGIRVLKITANGSSVLAEVQLGAQGDAGAALALDPAGNVYIAGTSTSGHLSATNGAAVGAAASNTINSYVAKFDSNLNLLFLSFTGGTQISASAIAASVDAVFVSGITYASDLPVTATGIGQQPAFGSIQNGFVERFSADGRTLVYATYLTGTLGDTTPTSLAVDALDDAWVVGSTSASGFPTVGALVPAMLSPPSGFLMRLTPLADSIVFSTFIPGRGLSSIALDSTGQTLLISGSVALGQFPVDSLLAPFVPTNSQVLLRLPLDGSTVLSGTVIAPGTQSIVTAAPNGAAWIAGNFASGMIPSLPQTPLATVGNAYAVRWSPATGIDQTVRLGGIANQQQTYASIPLNLTSAAVDGEGELIVGGSAQPTASSSLLATESYDLPLAGAPTVAFPSTVKDAEVSPSSCHGSLCAGSAAYFARIDPGNGSPALAFSIDDLPVVTLRNLGSEAAANLQLAVSSGTISTNCPNILAAGGECNLLVTGGDAATLTASSSTSLPVSASLPGYAAASPANSIVVSPKELDFGIATGASLPTLRTMTITNLGNTSTSFPAGLIGTPRSTPLITQQSSNCPPGTNPGTLTLAAGASCQLTVAFSSIQAASDGFVAGEWAVGLRQVMLTGYAQAAALSLSASELDFGTPLLGGGTPRSLFLSNSSTSPLAHTPVVLPNGSPFTVTDGCPVSLLPSSVCRIQFTYHAPFAPSLDSLTVQLDQGLSVLLSGQTIAAAAGGSSTLNPAFSVSPQNVTFGNAVVVTGVSSVTQTVGISNPGATDLPLTLALSGDFTQTSSCGSVLAAGSNCAVAVQFTPSQAGLRQGLLTVSAGTAATNSSVALMGEASAILNGNPTILDLGSLPVGQPATRFYKVAQSFNSLTVSTSGPYVVTLVEDTGFGPGQPPPSAFVTSGAGSCQNCWVGVRFQPQAAGAQPGVLTFSSAPLGKPFRVSLTGSGLATSGILINPGAQDFGSVPSGSSSGLLTLTITNAMADGSSITFTGISATGPFEISSATSLPCSGKLAFGASCIVAVRFAPTAVGSQSGQLTVVTSKGTLIVPLTGEATTARSVGISPLGLTFANTGDASALAQSVTLTNAGSVPVQIGSPTTANSAFQPVTVCGTLAPDATCTITVAFTPRSSPVQDTLSIPVLSAGSGGLTQTTTYQVALSGTYTSNAAGLQLLPNFVLFDPAAVSSLGALRQFAVVNSTAKPLALSTSLPANFFPSGPACTTLAPGASCTFNVQFAPVVAGDIVETISVTGTPSDGSSNLVTTAYPSGYGVGKGSITLSGGLIVNSAFSFGQVSPGLAASQTFTLTNVGDVDALPVNIRSITSAAPFSASDNCSATLTPGDTCSVSVTYSPMNSTSSSSASDIGALTIVSDAQSTPLILYLSGRAGTGASSQASPALAAFAVSQGSLAFAPTTVGDTSAPQTVQLTNTGNTLLHILAASVPHDFNLQNNCTTLAAADTCTMTIASSPQTAGDHFAGLEISSDANESLKYVSLFSVGTPPQLSFNPATLAFGSLQVGHAATLPVQITNTGSAAVTLSSIQASGVFSATGNCPGPALSLAAQASCTVLVTFAPVAAGPASGSLAFTTSATSGPLYVPLTGTGLMPQLTVSPGTLDFGSVSLGASATLPVALTNTGSTPLSTLILTASGDFSISLPCPGATLAPASSCQARITFTPSALGARTGTLSVSSSDPASPATIPLTGNGIPGPSFSLTANGGPSATLAITSGGFAVYSLALTPVAGFTGTVSLTCLPAQPTQYASCSLLPSQVTLPGLSPSLATATINTVTQGNGVARDRKPQLSQPWQIAWAMSLPGLYAILRRTRRAHTMLRRAAVASLLLWIALTGCGGSSNLHETPPGTYQFTVTASSTSGPAQSQTVTLVLVVNPG